jgi:hypothetical protein
MAKNQVNDPPSPQKEVLNKAAANSKAHVGTYVDTSLTEREVTNADQVVVPPIETNLGPNRPFYATDTVHEIDNEATNPTAPVPPHAPNKWAFGRDPYKNNGTDPYLQNQG